MKKPLLLLLVGAFLSGTATAQTATKAKPMTGTTPATTAPAAKGSTAPTAKGATGTTPAKAEAPPASAPALPKDFDPKIATDARASDGKAKEAPAMTAKPGDKNAKNLKPSNDAYEIGKTQLEKDDPKEAIEYFDKAIKLYPNNFQALLLRGKAKVMRKMYPEAVVDLNRAAKGMPDDPEVYFWRGRAKQEQDKDKEAVADMTKAIEKKPDMADAYYWRGHSYSEMDMLKESACPDFAKAAELGSELGSKAQKKYCK